MTTDRFVVVFDIGSTLIHPDFVALKCWLADRAGIVVDVDTIERAFRLAILGNVYQRAVEKPSAEAMIFFRHCGMLHLEDSVGLRLLWNEIVASGGVNSWLYSVLDPDAKPTLADLKRRGIRLIAASNSDGTLEAELAQFELLDYFDEIYDSTLIGFKKPSPDFYKCVLASSPDHRSVHVGDDLINDGLAAAACGFERVLLIDALDLLQGLPAYLKIRRLADITVSLGGCQAEAPSNSTNSR